MVAAVLKELLEAEAGEVHQRLLDVVRVVLDQQALGHRHHDLPVDLGLLARRLG